MVLQQQKLKKSFSTFYFQWILLSAFWIGGIQSHITHLSQVYPSSGLVFQLQCNEGSQKENISVNWNWSRSQNQSLEHVPGINIKGGTLWFLPAHPSHSGNYSCFSREGSKTFEKKFEVSVENKACPHITRTDAAKSTISVRCLLDHIFELDPQAQITWLRNCSPLNVNYGKFFPINRSTDMDGLYTCIVNFTIEGRKYSAAQTTKIYSLSPSHVEKKPTLIFPKNETLKVTLGESYTLKCKAFIWEKNTDETLIYWLNNSQHLQLDIETEEIVMENDMWFKLSSFHIPHVTAQHLNNNFSCVVLSPRGLEIGHVLLIPDDQGSYILMQYTWMILGLVTLLVLLGTVMFFQFKVDLVLAYRDLCSPLAVQSDGKSYDAYVSYLHGDQCSLSSAMTFALHFLPAELEDLYGYKLFISSRDELPGEAVHDVIADRMSRSRRLIIVLTSQSFTKLQPNATKCILPEKHTESLLSDNDQVVAQAYTSSAQIWGTYEQHVGIYDALVKQGLKVILVQVGDGVKDAQLPESLRYIRRTTGILKWKQHCSDDARKKFWKYLRYRMPPAQQQKSKQVMML